MAGDVSIRVRAVDMTRAVFGRIREQLSGLERGVGKFGYLSRNIAALHKYGAGFAIGYAAIRGVNAVRDKFREIMEYAKETGNYDLISERTVRNADKIASIIDNFKTNFAITAGNIVGSFKGSDPNEVSWEQEAARIKDRDARIKAARARIEKTKDDDSLAGLLRKETAQQAALKATPENQMAIKAEREADLAETRLAIAKEIARQEEQGAKDQIDYAEQIERTKEETRKQELAAQEELKKRQDDELDARRNAMSRRINDLSSGIQADGRAFFDASNSRRISSRASAAMGERINRLTGDDQTKYQMQTASILAQIYRMLGGTGGR